jgi:4-amino-4-deoxy-L-arabinose transferase-like glycosyltransferase
VRSLRSAAPWVVLATVLIRLPGFAFGILGSDDADFTVIARAMAQGALPYREVVDIKPPLTFVCYLPNAWFGVAYWPVQTEAVLFVAATALALGAAAERTWRSPRAGVLAAFLALAAGLCEAPTVSTELLMNLPTALALALYARGSDERRPGDDLLAGFLLGLAALIRHQAVFSLGALGGATLALGIWGRRPWLLRCALLAVGFTVPWVAMLGVFQSLGASDDMIDWVILRNLRYVSQNAGSTTLRLAQALAVCVLAAAPVAWWSALCGARTAVREVAAAFRPDATGDVRLRFTWALLLLVSCVPVSLGGRFYEHYFLQFVPPIALLGAGPLDAALSGIGARSRVWRVALAAAVFVPVLGSVGYATVRGLVHRYPLQNEKVEDIGRWIRANTAPSDRLFVWGHTSAVYLAADRTPGTRYVTTSWHLGNFDPEHIDDRTDLRAFRSERDVNQTLDDLSCRKPEWIIDTTPTDIHAWHRMPLSLLPELESAIEAGWEPVAATPGGARILRRRSTPAAGSATPIPAKACPPARRHASE